MLRFENQCLGCEDLGMHCLGAACPRRRVEVHVCDRCGEELGDFYEVDGEELCEDCADIGLEDEEEEIDPMTPFADERIVKQKIHSRKRGCEDYGTVSDCE